MNEDYTNFSPSAETFAFASNALFQRLSSGSGGVITLFTEERAEAVEDFSASQCRVENSRGNEKGNID